MERIYRAGIETGLATFETTTPSWEAWDSVNLPDLRLAAVTDRLVGWIAAKRVSTRHCYRGVIEHSVYVDPASARQGIGRRLLEALIERSEGLGYWTIQTAIFPENGASISLHQGAGFRVVGTQELLGESQGVWRDVVVMERRSPTVGR
ncbi:MAG TPA: GNAT family N-acetyltransferase [Acidimicrobiia bacterium]|nr:GNAT family N-acetyltransferase [Acidimicrobiia bacterium]